MDTSTSNTIQSLADNANTEKDQLSNKQSPDINTENPTACGVITSDLQNVPSTSLEEEDSVLGVEDSTKDYDVNLDEDELLKDVDSDDIKTSNSEIVNSESVGTEHLENEPDTNVDPTKNVPQQDLDSDRKTESPVGITLGKTYCNNLAVKDTKLKEPDLQPDAGNIVENGTELVTEHSKLGNINITSNSEESETNDKSATYDNKENKEVTHEECSTINVNNTLDGAEGVSNDVENNSTESISDVNEKDISISCETTLSQAGEVLDTSVMETSTNSDSSPKPHVSEKSEKEHEVISGTCEKEHEDNTEACEKEHGNNNETNLSGEGNGSVSETDCGRTNFLHVEQDSSHPEESNETGGEDPFAQTSDDLMNISQISDKDNEAEKGDTSQQSDAMDVDDIPVHSNQQSTTSSVKLLEVGEKNSDNTVAEMVVDIVGLNSEKKDSNSSDNIAESKINNKKNDIITSPTLDSNAEVVVCVDPDNKNVSRNKESPKLPTPVTAKSKPATPSGKIKQKKKRLSDISSDEDSGSDIEISKQPIQRPKRNAAKKAESQIKVVREVEEAVEREDGIVAVTPADNADEEEEELQACYFCKKVTPCKINILSYGQTNYFCNDDCFTQFRDGPLIKPGECTEIVPPSTAMKEIRSADIPPIERASFTRKCSKCVSVIDVDSEKTLSWETMEFCNEECLGKYQTELGSHCANCKGNVQPASLGKYCVRFGYEVKQFCCSTCLEEFKKGLKVCSFCQKDISSGVEGFLAPVGDKGTFKDFCTPGCMEKYEQMSSNKPPPPQTSLCHVCNDLKQVEVEVFFQSKFYKLCSEICFNAYKFANNLTVDRCDMCRKYFDKSINGEKFNIHYEGVPHNFCCKTCMNVYILAKRKIVPCNWCKVKKYNFDMIKRVLGTGQALMMCSLNCMTLYQVSVNAVSSRRIKCDMCLSVAQAQYHLTMSDATIRNFCTYPCVMNFQQQYTKNPITLPGSDAAPIPTGGPVPVVSSVTSLVNGQTPSTGTKQPQPPGKMHLTMRLQEPPTRRNKCTQTRPIMNTKSVSCRPHSISVPIQTDESKGRPVIIPIPVPIYVPCPMAMYSLPYPVPVPFPLPVPVPVFLPTTRNSIKGIMKELKRIHDKVPADPFEAELLMMAEMVAADKKEEVTSSESEAENEPEPDPESAPESRANSDAEDGDFAPEPIETNNSFGDDIMQMAFKMASELDEPEPALSLENQLTPATGLNQSTTDNALDKVNNVEDTEKATPATGEKKGKKRLSTSSPQKSGTGSEKKRKKNEKVNTAPVTTVVEEVKPDANMKLKYTFGVNAWKSWVQQKNAEIEKLSSTNKKLKPLKSDILQLTVDELNFCLCMFVKEVKKPNGTPYAPDTIFYLCLGIQQYLFENGRIENIFTDSYFEPFTDSLDETARKFSELFNDHHYIVTRVEEEHLWECKQLGAHSPHVLLTTLMFFNTKHFNLVNADEHLMLSFSHIMKHWKRNSNQASLPGGAKAQGSRNVLLRFYPPQSVFDDPNCKKKKVYEQQENEENPLRCPVKLYEFYLSKCPESVKSRNDVFYLAPERSCVPDSPVWYSTMALSKEPLEKMLNRVKMVKEINIALLIP